jgi:hypothetical protein
VNNNTSRQPTYGIYVSGQPEEEFEFEVQTETDLAELAPEVSAIHAQAGRSPLWSGICDRDTGLGKTLDRLEALALDSSLTGGDLDTDQYLAKVVGEEAVGGTTPTPDQNVVEDLAVSAGVEIPDNTALHTSEMLEERDSHRWELEPESSEDYETRYK